MIEVINTAGWVPSQFKDNFGQAAICDLQVTEIKITGNYPEDAFGSSAGRPYSVCCYVRENVSLAMGGFTVSSQQRWGMKKKGSVPSTAKQVLEIALPGQLIKDEVLLKDICRQINEADPMKRSVTTNRLFTITWASNLMKTQ